MFGSVPMPFLVVAVGMGLAAGALAAVPVAAARVVAIGLYVLVSGLFESAHIMLPAVSWFPGQPALIVLAAVSLGHFFVTAGSTRYITSRNASPQLRSVLEALMHDEDSSSFPSIRRREPLPRTKIGVGL